jgi:hypothetical protein
MMFATALIHNSYQVEKFVSQANMKLPDLLTNK